MSQQTCQHLQLIGALHDGQLPPEQAGALEQHLRSCPECAAERARLQRLTQLLRSAPPPHLSQISLARLHRAVDSAVNPLLLHWARRLASAAAAIFVAASLFAVTQTRTPGTATAELSDLDLTAMNPSAVESSSASEVQLADWIVTDLSRSGEAQ